MSTISSSCTAYAAKLVTEQLYLSIKINYEVQPPSEGVIEVLYGTHRHDVQVDKAICSCAFSKTMGLPCRHVFVARRSLDYLHVCNFEDFMIQKRWLASYQINVNSEDTSNVEGDVTVYTTKLVYILSLLYS